MTKKALSLAWLRQALLAAGLVGLLAGSASAGRSADAVTGTEIGDFSLPSQQGRLVTYEDEYYGKHHLILTFFPAAFTPT